MFIVNAAAALAAPLAAEAQPTKTARVGFLSASGRLAFESGERRVYREAFITRMRELGWVEGQNLVVESRYAEGEYEPATSPRRSRTCR